MKNIIRSIIEWLILLSKRIYRWSLGQQNTKDLIKLRFPHVKFLNTNLIEIGQRVFIGNGASVTALTNVTIGDDTMIAPEVMILTATHNLKNHPMWKETIIRPVSIGKHVWIGARAIILPGVVIDDFAVIGAGTVISRHVPNCAVVVGNPARIIKYREVPDLDVEIQRKYPYWVDVFEDYLPSESITKQLDKP